MTVNPDNVSPKDNLRGCRIIFSALVMGVVFFAAAVLGLSYIEGYEIPMPGENNVFLGIVVVVALIFLLFASRAYKKGSEDAKNLTGTVSKKMDHYRSNFILYMALCEGPALFSLIGVFLTGDKRLLAVTAFMVLAMMAVMPSKKRVVNYLGLDWKEEQEL